MHLYKMFYILYKPKIIEICHKIYFIYPLYETKIPTISFVKVGQLMLENFSLEEILDFQEELIYLDFKIEELKKNL